MTREAEFADDQHVEWRPKGGGDLEAYGDAAAGERKHDGIRPGEGRQCLPERLARGAPVRKPRSARRRPEHDQK